MIVSKKIYYGKAPSQFGFLNLPQEKRDKYTTIVTIHGGFWQSFADLTQLQTLTNGLNQRGYAVWNIEYRRIGETGAGWPGTFNDVIDAINFLTELAHSWPIDKQSVIILGHSAGGHLALWAGLRYRNQALDHSDNIHRLSVKPRMVVSLAAVSNLEDAWQRDTVMGKHSPVTDLMAGTPANKKVDYQSASPLDCLPMGIPQILVQGLKDDFVPSSMTIQYAEKAEKLHDHIELILDPDADHFDLINPHTRVWQKTIVAMKETLKA
ncbi:MAG: alpha/beta hydrolase [Oenococcus sp.]|uniref:alpha/beta hydrolase family protein n=1 Tax=Oenococcus TaxID=46254 RepID=UPI0021E89F10|nr:alpha/beta hydrolase [Oenococcus kitaharae]MCV3295830.1 alpha/beta hydrolase [Oenococcus kitaharae]